MDIGEQRQLPPGGGFGAGQGEAEEDKVREEIKEVGSGRVLGA